MNDETDTGGIAAALNELADAHHELVGCQAAVSMARAKETDARNRCNNAQKAVDKAMAQIRANAPKDTDWRANPSHTVVMGGTG